MSSPMSDYSDSTYSTKPISKDDNLSMHQDIVQDFNQNWERAYQLLNTFYAEAYRDVSCYLGNQWSLEELSYLNNQRRSSFTYNYQRKGINLILGHQIKNRLASKVEPVEASSQETAQILNDALQHVMTSGNGYGELSKAFKGGLISGLSFISPWVDYRDDPINGDIKFKVDDWNAVCFDPFADLTKKDLSDCSFIARRKFLSRTEVISLLPNKEDVIKNLPYGSRDDKFTYLPYARQWGMQKLLNYTEYWKTEWESETVLIDTETGETTPWKGDAKRLNLYQALYPSVKVIKKQVRTVKLAIIVEGQLLYYGKDPNGLNEYPFVPLTPVFENSYDLWSWKLQSLIRISRDSQVEFNKRRSKAVDQLDNSLNSGWVAKTNSVSNPQSLYKTGQGQVIFMKPESQMTDLQRIEPARVDQSAFQLEQEFQKDVYSLMGINPEMFGMAENENIETAGILSKMRQNAGLVNLQPVFEDLNDAQKVLSEKVLKLIQLNYSAEKIFLITKKRPTDEFFSQNFSKYNIVVEEGILTDTQQQADFMQRLALKSIGVQITDEELIDSSNIHDKKTIKDRIATQAQAQKESEDLQLKLAMNQQATVTRSLNAKSHSDDALAEERLNKINLDKALSAERIARSEEDRSAGMLNLIKAVKELEGMDVQALINKVQLLQSIDLHEITREQSIKELESPQPLPKAG